jgi:hypothetical protein
MFNKLTKRFRNLHNEQRGLEALQVVMIIAIAAMVMIACATVGQKAVTWMNGQWGTLQGTSISADGGGNSGGGQLPHPLPGNANLKDWLE